jgi:putative membrane protein
MKSDASHSADMVQDPRVYLAAERTFLAWIRTGLALMGFGFVVARFSLLIRELNLNVPSHTLSSIGVSSRVGIALILLGVIVNVASTIGYISMIRRLARGDILDRPSKLAIALSLVLAVTGCLAGAYLVSFP